MYNLEGGCVGGIKKQKNDNNSNRKPQMRGCAATIKKGILGIHSVEQVDVNVETSEVHITHQTDVILEIKEKLSKLGYPEKGSRNSTVHKAKSFVSCAVGRWDA